MSPDRLRLASLGLFLFLGFYPNSQAQAAAQALHAGPEAKEEIRLSPPYYGQTLDWPWGGDFMGDARALFADNGCIVTCAAMSLSGFGYDIDPGRLNAALIKAGLYTQMSFRGEALGRMGFSYESIPKLFPGLRLKMRGKLKGQADIDSLKAELAAGRPLIATVLFRKSYNHAILIYGWSGGDFLIHDPMDQRNKTLTQYNRAAENAFERAFDCVIGTAVYYPGSP